MPGTGRRKVPVAHHLMVVHPLLQTPCPGGSRSLSQDHRDSLEAVGEDTTASNATDVASTMDAMVRKALVQHGARNAAFARALPLQSSMQEWCQEGSRRRPSTEAGNHQEISGQIQTKGQVQNRCHRAEDSSINKGGTF